MLAHPRARRALRQYVEQWLYLDALPESFALGADMKEETYRLFERLVWEEDTDLMQAFTEKRAELSGDLAEFYGLSPLESGFATYDLGAVPERIGFMTNASVLGARVINPTSSMIDRGLFVLNDLFCQTVPPPDAPELRAAIDEIAVPETSGLSQRERFATQSEEALCLGCHARFDPLGLAFEQYGSAGQHITEDEFGNSLPGGGDLAVGDVEVDYSTVEEFASALGGSESVARCAVQKSLQHAYGRSMAARDQDLVSDIYAEFAANGRTYRALIRAIAAHPEFVLVEVAP
jgi:succinate dehydrogenase flavin-adding protein (antitoxin of CptAB toxin-antitoxin module)